MISLDQESIRALGRKALALRSESLEANDRLRITSRWCSAIVGVNGSVRQANCEVPDGVWRFWIECEHIARAEYFDPRLTALHSGKDAPHPLILYTSSSTKSYAFLNGTESATLCKALPIMLLTLCQSVVSTLIESEHVTVDVLRVVKVH